ncbi:RDD family protein [Lysobacter sp. K5869]|uniref:RDD family protein n=1 Tax=Lysobacter sp. K5869 TaxID=2820808 RepID=UPI001C05F408|nr:RDD family protein [Lysobacter sp. K5869]QWP77838.1 RDD family protein [Lysobacter sp. K5869]
MNDLNDSHDLPRTQHRAERIAALVPASRAQRLANLLIDSAICAAAVLGGITVYAAVDPEVLKVLQPASPDTPWNPRMSLIMLLVQFAYYVPMEGIFGVTLGKLVTSTRTVDEEGRPPSWTQVLARTALRQIPFEPISILFGDPARARAWHDRFSKTLVVRTASPMKR